MVFFLYVDFFVIITFLLKEVIVSVQINQYLIYGVKLNYKEYQDRFEEFEPFMDSAFEDDMNPKGLHCIFDGMNGKYIYIGRCLKKSLDGEYMDSFEIPEISDDIKDLTRILVESELGIKEPMSLQFVTHYR